MVRLALLAFAAGFGLAWWLATRNAAQPVEPVDEDRFDLAGLDDRMKQYDRDFDANNRLRRR